MQLIPGKIYKIHNSRKEDIMRVCGGFDYDFMAKNLDCPLFLLSETTKTKGVHSAPKNTKTQNKNNITTTIFLVKDRTVEFRTVEILLDFYASHTRALLLNALFELK